MLRGLKHLKANTLADDDQLRALCGRGMLQSLTTKQKANTPSMH